jgi:hypothetical protein
MSVSVSVSVSPSVSVSVSPSVSVSVSVYVCAQGVTFEWGDMSVQTNAVEARCVRS